MRIDLSLEQKQALQRAVMNLTQDEEVPQRALTMLNNLDVGLSNLLAAVVFLEKANADPVGREVGAIADGEARVQQTAIEFANEVLRVFNGDYDNE